MLYAAPPLLIWTMPGLDTLQSLALVKEAFLLVEKFVRRKRSDDLQSLSQLDWSAEMQYFVF